MAGPPSSSSGPGRRPFKAVARVRIPLGVRPAQAGATPVTSATSARSCGAVGVLAALSRRRSRVQVPSGPQALTPRVVCAAFCVSEQVPCRRRTRRLGTMTRAARPGSSVGTSVRLKIGRSAVRPRPWPHSLSPGYTAPTSGNDGRRWLFRPYGCHPELRVGLAVTQAFDHATAFEDLARVPNSAKPGPVLCSVEAGCRAPIRGVGGGKAHGHTSRSAARRCFHAVDGHDPRRTKGYGAIRTL